MNPFNADTHRTTIIRPAKDVPVWTNYGDGDPVKTYPQNVHQSTKTFAFINGHQYRTFGRDLAVLEKSGTRKLADLSPDERATAIASPKWSPHTLRKGIQHIPEHVHYSHTFSGGEWKQTPIVYYGVRLHQSHSPNLFHTWTSVHVHATPQVVYSHVKTEECPHPIPFLGTLVEELIYGNQTPTPVLTDAFTALIAEEKRRLRTDAPHISSLLAVRTTLWTQLLTYTWRPRSEGKKAKTIVHVKRSHNLCELRPVFPLVFLTDLSTRADVPSVNTPVGVYDGSVGDRRPRNLGQKLEETRQLRGELKRLLAEAVYHPDRLERMATAHGVDFETYLLALSGEKD